MQEGLEFSFATRQESLRKLRSEEFDVLIIGGGITGAAVARDAALRKLKVALIEKGDFAVGTSSRSSKLIHGGLRYLENFEFGLVFEALRERAHLLKTVPHLVKPLRFYFPVYQHDKNSILKISAGMWLYDLLSMFQAPGFHKHLNRDQFSKEIPILINEGLKGGFAYSDASMWDDVLTVQTLRSARAAGAHVVNYVKGLSPIWSQDWITGFRAKETLIENSPLFDIRAKTTILCVGPWTDELGAKISPAWKPWLNPSKGVHLVFDLKRIPLPGALVMHNRDDGRIVFVIPRTDLGSGVVIVGTTDSPLKKGSPEPEKARVDQSDVDYLLALLQKYFPTLHLTYEDVLSAYVGVRPLVEFPSQGAADGTVKLQKISREHHIDEGPGGITIVAGGKYTTHRNMAEEIVDFMLSSWQKRLRKGYSAALPQNLEKASTKTPPNPWVLRAAVDRAKNEAAKKGIQIPQHLWEHYGAEALDLFEMNKISSYSDQASSASSTSLEDPEGFPWLAAQLRFSIRRTMAMRLEDFYFRRLPLFLARKDHGLPWVDLLLKVWAEERSATPAEMEAEKIRFTTLVNDVADWR